MEVPEDTTVLIEIDGLTYRCLASDVAALMAGEQVDLIEVERVVTTVPDPP
jgi:hypothetical protein